jgi:hypothetical protein
MERVVCPLAVLQDPLEFHQNGPMLTNHAERLLRETGDFAGAGHLVDVPGMSSPRVCHFLNRLVACMDPGEHYLEIGSWQGRTLLSAAFENRGRLCIACDRFRFFGRYTGFGYRARRALGRNLARYAGRRAAVHFYDMDSSRFFRRCRFDGSIGVYFYDGDHSYTGTRRSIAAGAERLSARAIVLVDDWNVRRIRAGTLDGLRDAAVRVLWHRALEGDHTEATWWNGLGVFYVETTRTRAPAIGAGAGTGIDA